MASTATSSIYRADHVGSFLRSKELLDARHAGADPEPLREIEDREIRRISDASKYTSMAEGNLVAEAEQWAKLQVVVDTARKVWR